jgi:hypothetical protein
MGRGGPSAPGAEEAAYTDRLKQNQKNNVAPVPRTRGNQMLPQPYVAPERPVRLPPKIPGLTNQQSHSTPHPPPPPHPPPASSSSSARGMPPLANCSHRRSLHRGANNGTFLFEW